MYDTRFSGLPSEILTVQKIFLGIRVFMMGTLRSVGGRGVGVRNTSNKDLVRPV